MGPAATETAPGRDAIGGGGHRDAPGREATGGNERDVRRQMFTCSDQLTWFM